MSDLRKKFAENAEQFDALMVEMLARNEVLAEALERSVIALDDWTNTYANAFCDEMRVKEAEERLSEKGTLWYIAQVQKRNRKALAQHRQEEGK